MEGQEAEKVKILFIVNPISGVKRKISIEDVIEAHLDHGRFHHSIHYTTSKGDATSQSQKAISDGFAVVVAVGGDGTINEVAQGIVHSKVALAVIPRGSGNGFANYFNIPHDPVRAIKLINRYKTQPIDTGLLNDKLFLSVAGIGFDARVSTAFDTFGRRGLFSYMYISIREYFKYVPRKYTIHLNDQKITKQALLITAANSSQFGNNAYIAPNAKIDDGLLDLVILKPTNIFNQLLISIRMFNGSLHRSSYCETYQVKNLKIIHEDAEGQIDGEPISLSDQTTITVQPNSLIVVS